MNTVKALRRVLLALLALAGALTFLVLLINSLPGGRAPQPLAAEQGTTYPQPLIPPQEREPFDEPPPGPAQEQEIVYPPPITPRGRDPYSGPPEMGMPLEVVQTTLASIDGPMPTGTLHPALQPTGPYYTETPYPTSTPPPTATRRPGPTRTPIPPATPPADAEGVIWYAQIHPVEGTADDWHPRSFSTYFQIVMGPDGFPKGPPEKLSIPEAVTQKLELKQRLSLTYPSPTNRFWLFELPIPESDSYYYVFDRATNRLETPFDPNAVPPGNFYGWHPDGQHFLFWPDSGPLQLVHAETFETTELVAFTDHAHNVQGAALSPDGRLVAYSDYYISEKGEYLGDFLWMVSTEGGDARPLPELGPVGEVYPLAWSPDSTRLIYTGNCVSPEIGQYDEWSLCLYDTRTGESQDLSIPFYSGDTAWSLDGRFLAATGYSGSEPACTEMNDPTTACWYQGKAVYLKDMETGEVRELVKGAFPSWSPDGSVIIFLSYQTGAEEIWAFNLQTNDLYQLTSDGQEKISKLNWFN